MKIYFGSDHAGFMLKSKLVTFAKSLGCEVLDLGPDKYDPLDDYPDYVVPVVKAVLSDKDSRGVILGGSGQGEAMVANRFKGIRAVVFNGQYAPKDNRELPNEIKISREHNDSNVLSLGARFLNEEEATEALKLWLDTEFSNEERHVRRLEKIDSCS